MKNKNTELQILEEIWKSLDDTAKWTDDISTGDEEMQQYIAELDKSANTIIEKTKIIENQLKTEIEDLLHFICCHPQYIRGELAARIKVKLAEQGTEDAEMTNTDALTR